MTCLLTLQITKKQDKNVIFNIMIVGQIHIFSKNEERR